MEKQFGIIAKITDMFTKLTLTAFAEEEGEEGETDVDDTGDGDNSQDSGDNSNDSRSSINYEDLIAKARKEEKSKLYPKIERLEKKIEELTEKNNKKVLKVEELNEQIESLENDLETAKEKATQSDDKRVQDLQSEIEEKESKIESLQKQVDDIEPVNEEELRKEIREEVENEFEVKLYKEQKINEAEGEVIPELVIGETKEEIDETFEKAQERYNEIVENTGRSNNNNQRRSADNPSTDSTGELDLANANPRNMSDEDYAEFRKKVGLGTNKRGTMGR